MWKRPHTAEVNPLVDGHTPQYNRAAWVDLLIQFVLGALAILFFVLFVLQINQINPNHCSEDELVDRLWLDVNYSAQEQTAYPLYMDDNGYMIANHLHDGSSTGCDAALHKALVARDQTTATMFDTESTERRRLVDTSYTLTGIGRKNKKLKVVFSLKEFSTAFGLNKILQADCKLLFTCLQTKSNCQWKSLSNMYQCYTKTCDDTPALLRAADNLRKKKKLNTILGNVCYIVKSSVISKCDKSTCY